MPLSVFMVFDINFIKMVFSKLISHLFPYRLSIRIAKKQELLTHFRDANFDTMEEARQ